MIGFDRFEEVEYEFICICGKKEIDSYDKDFWICPICKIIWKVERYGEGNIFIYEQEN